jgi:hypothetical protein
MLAALQKHGRAILYLALIWLAFESLISWAAFCDSVDKQTEQKATVEYECIFRGPVVSGIRSFHGWWKHTFHEPDAYVALFTAVLAIFTLALWQSTDKLWKAGEHQIAVTKEAADAAQVSAQAAADSVQIAKESLERAYVVAAAIKPSTFRTW